MKAGLRIILLLFLIQLNSCIEPYIPKRPENDEMLVVEGMITDQHEINTFKLFRSLPLWKKQNAKVVKGCRVWLSDDLGRADSLKETFSGTYVTDSSKFQGIVGREYTLHIITGLGAGMLHYESTPMMMQPVPPVSQVYYEKNVYITYPRDVEGCQIYLDTYDPTGKCSFFRWTYSETWEFHLPFDVINKICWITNNSYDILIKNTSILAEDRISRYPVITIPDPIDKLSVKYSILVRQLSMNGNEYLYWDRLNNISGQVGGLYDLIPSVIPNNIYCIEKPDEKILGYFSVSAVTTKRCFVKDKFTGLDEQYEGCITDTIYGTSPIPGLDASVWILINHPEHTPPMRVVTNIRGCADCMVRGTNIKPLFWDDDKK